MPEYYFFAGIFADVLMPEAYQHLNFHLQVFSSCFTSVTRESYPKLDKYLKPLAINGTIHTKLWLDMGFFCGLHFFI